MKLEHYSIPEPNSGCTIWLGALTDGYGRVRIEGKLKLAHVVSYELTKGKVPDGLELDHLCRVRCCINPDHLEPVTSSENTKRGMVPTVNKLRGAKITHCKHGHEFTKENTYMHNGWRECRTCNRLRDSIRRASKC